MILPTEPPALRVDRFAIWLGPVTDNAAYESDIALQASLPASPSRLTEPRHAAIFTRGISYDQRGIGYLHAIFEPSLSHEVTLVVAVGRLLGDGLEPIFAQPVLDALAFAAPTSLVPHLGAGTLTVARALVHPVDSTAWGFTRLALRLATLFEPTLDTSSETAVQTRWEAVQAAWAGREHPRT